VDVTLNSGALHIDPCIPAYWPRYEAVLTTEHAEMRIVVENPEGVNRGVRVLELDGTAIHGDVPLAEAVGTHTVRVVLGGRDLLD
jgi:cellobiose phosphorylase